MPVLFPSTHRNKKLPASKQDMAVLKPGIILKCLYERIGILRKKPADSEQCVGLSYVGVKLDNSAAGLAAVLPMKNIQSRRGYYEQ
jgi:hypothetical protein